MRALAAIPLLFLPMAATGAEPEPPPETAYTSPGLATAMAFGITGAFGATAAITRLEADRARRHDRDGAAAVLRTVSDTSLVLTGLCGAVAIAAAIGAATAPRRSTTGPALRLGPGSVHLDVRFR